MKKSLVLLWFFGFWMLFAWCNSQNVWDVEYDLTTEMWRNLHCSAMFQKAGVAELKGTHWVSEREVEDTYLLEWRMETDKGDYYTTCVYLQDGSDWYISISPVDDLSWTINPSTQYCLSNGWTYSIDENETSIFSQCSFDDGLSCNAWDYYYWVCPSTLTNYSLLSPSDRIMACQDRVGFYLNFGTWSFVWNDEVEDWNLYLRNWNVEYEKWWEKWVADIDCTIDMEQWTVEVEFSNHAPLDNSEVD